VEIVMYSACHPQHSAACGLDAYNAEPLVVSLVALNSGGRWRPRGHMDGGAKEPRKPYESRHLQECAAAPRKTKSGLNFFSLANHRRFPRMQVAFGRMKLPKGGSMSFLF